MIAYVIPPSRRTFLNNYSYHDYAGIGDSREPHVFPFHPICYEEILQRCIRQEKSEQLRKDVLFDVFEDLNGGGGRYVRL